MTVAILVAIIALSVLVAVVLWWRIRPAKVVTTPAGNQTVLRFGSGTTVELGESGAYRPRLTADGSVVTPLPRRRLPGLMPTAGHAIIPKRASVRSMMTPRSLTDELDLSDEN